MAPENNSEPKDLQWFLSSVESETLKLHNISFYLNQPTSECVQETENSITIKLSEEQQDNELDNINLSHFLIVLTTSKSPLNNLEFHQVEWNLQQVQNLGLLLDNLSVKQVVFKRNKFESDSMTELGEILRRNNGIKEVMFYGSSLKHVGATCLASALKDNECLEELQIWEDSIGSKGAEELSKMIEVNPNLKSLTIFDSNSITATPLVSAVLARNRAMEVHVWCGGKNGDISKVVEFVNMTLKIYRLDVSGCCRVATAMGMNSTVRTLDMSGVRLKSRWGKEFRYVLEQNRTLKEVTLSKTGLKDKGIVYVAAGLFRNCSLESLFVHDNRFSGIGVEHLLCPLSRFSSLQSQANVSLKSVTFGGGRSKIGRDGVAAILQMITTNETVTRLGIYDDKSLRPDDFVRMFKSLQKNASLRQLSLQGCRGVRGELVQEAIMETLQVNPRIEDIDLERTPLKIAGNADGIYQKLGQKEKSEPDLEVIKDMPLTEPKSCRVFFCGQEYAGK